MPKYLSLSFVGAALKWVCIALLCKACTSDKPTTPTTQSSGNAAIDALTTQIQQNPTDKKLYTARAKLFYEMEAYDEAGIDLQKAISLDSNDVASYHLLADTYLDNAKSKEGLAIMEQTAARFGTHIPTLLKLSEYQLILRQYEPCFRTIESILKQDPQNAEGYFMLGTVFMDSGDTSKAFGSFQKAVELDADLTDAYINLGQISERKNPALAAQYYDNAVRDTNNLQARYAKALFLQKQNKPAEALALYRSIIARDAQYANAYFNTGIIYLEQDSLAKARNNFEIVTKIEPTNAKAYFYRGLTKEKEGDKQGARNDYEQTLRFEPNFERATNALQALNK